MYLVLVDATDRSKDSVIFSYFRLLVEKSDQKAKTKYGMNEKIVGRIPIKKGR